ncbi:hypothetical protein B0H14DRAFT_3518900 [Mycena olivaceomarginata]|nr:hypothetical protein B0H14DRAFT_3518900 [Mycena olivaceomarginata]
MLRFPHSTNALACPSISQPGPRPPTARPSTPPLPADIAPISLHLLNLVGVVLVSAQCFGCSSLDLGLLCLLELVHTDVLYRGHSSNLCGHHRVVNTGKRVHSELWCLVSSVLDDPGLVRANAVQPGFSEQDVECPITLEDLE